MREYLNYKNAPLGPSGGVSQCWVKITILFGLNGSLGLHSSKDEKGKCCRLIIDYKWTVSSLHVSLKEGRPTLLWRTQKWIWQLDTVAVGWFKCWSGCKYNTLCTETFRLSHGYSQTHTQETSAILWTDYFMMKEEKCKQEVKRGFKALSPKVGL